MKSDGSEEHFSALDYHKSPHLILLLKDILRCLLEYLLGNHQPIWSFQFWLQRTFPENKTRIISILWNIINLFK